MVGMKINELGLYKGEYTYFYYNPTVSQCYIFDYDQDTNKLTLVSDLVKRITPNSYSESDIAEYFMEMVEKYYNLKVTSYEFTRWSSTLEVRKQSDY